MPTRKRVAAFVDAVVYGDHADAIAEFYDEQASMQENQEPPRVGRAALIAHEQAALSQLVDMKAYDPELVIVDGDHVSIVWTFDATGMDGVTRRLNEVALQIWSGDRIVKERFVYDTATAWQSVSPSNE